MNPFPLVPPSPSIDDATIRAAASFLVRERKRLDYRLATVRPEVEADVLAGYVRMLTEARDHKPDHGTAMNWQFTIAFGIKMFLVIVNQYIECRYVHPRSEPPDWIWDRGVETFPAATRNPNPRLQ